MKELYVVCVCGFGLGTSLILKMNIDDVFEKAGIKARVEPLDITSAIGVSADMIVSSNEFYEQLKEANSGIPVYAVSDFLDKDLIRDTIVEAARELAEA